MKRSLNLDESPAKRSKQLPWYQRLPPFNWIFQSSEPGIEPTLPNESSSKGMESIAKVMESSSTDNSSDCQIVKIVETSFKTPESSNLFQNINQTPKSTPSQHARLSWMNSTSRTSTPSSSRSSRLGISSHRLSSVRKQGVRKQSLVIEKLKKQFVPGYKAAASSGYTGSKQDYEGLIDYMQRVKEVEVKMGLEEPIHVKPVEILKKQDTIHELLWIAELRTRINQALHTPEIAIEQLTLKDETFKNLVEKEKETEAKIKELLAPKKKVDLFPPLSPEDVRKVEQAQRGEGTVVDKFSLAIQKKDLRTLQGSSWLNDEVINFYAELIMDRAKKNPEKYPKVHVFNTFFYHLLQTKGYAGVRRWSKKFDVFSKDYIIIPVHMGMHWCCAVIDFKEKKFRYYDSLHGNNSKCLKLLREYVEQESLDKKKVAYDTSDWKDETPKVSMINKDCPAQENGFDCGVFTCMFMEFTARNQEFLFRQKHMPYLRKRIALEIINSELMAQ